MFRGEGTTMKIRKSKWTMYLICPRMYKCRWLLNLPMVNGVEMQYGRDFHRRAKEFFDEVDTKTLIHCDKAIHAYNMCFESFTPRRSSVMREWMNNFLWWEAKEWMRLLGLVGSEEAIKYWKPLETELKFETDDATYTVDRIDVLPLTKKLINIEYKSGKWFFKKKLVEELTFYNIGINESGRFKVPCTHIGYYNPQLDKAFAEFAVKPVKEFVRGSVKEFFTAHESSLFPCRISNFCRYCSYLIGCPCWEDNQKEV